MFVVVSYDIADDRKRSRVLKILKDYGTHVQKSVFECKIDEAQYLKLREKITEFIDPDTDSVRYYELCARCRRAIEFVGAPPELEGRNHMIV